MPQLTLYLAELEIKTETDTITFKIYHNIPTVEGPVNSLYAALDNWVARTEEYTAESFVKYINSKNVYTALTEEQYDKIGLEKYKQ